jgi:hypothetical protein
MQVQIGRLLAKSIQSHRTTHALQEHLLACSIVELKARWASRQQLPASHSAEWLVKLDYAT